MTLTGIHMFDYYETHPWDRPLLEKLGLKPFERIKVWEKHFIGRVECEDGWVDITVTGAPAQFFHFEIFSKEANRTTVVDTGSGCLADYWPIAEKILTSMFSIKSVEVGEKKRN